MSSSDDRKLMDRVQQVLRVKHYAISTEKTYCDWIRQYIKFHKMQDESELAIQPEKKVEVFLSYLATERNVAISTQNQAMSALVFLYKQVLGTPLEYKVDAIRSTKERKIPVVLTQDEIKQVITLLGSWVWFCLFSIRKVKTFDFQANRFISYRCRKRQSLVSRMVCER